jgi:hypothetical protein
MSVELKTQPASAAPSAAIPKTGMRCLSPKTHRNSLATQAREQAPLVGKRRLALSGLQSTAVSRALGALRFHLQRWTHTS